MLYTDIINVFYWWVVLFTISIIFIPLSNRIFTSFFDKGYLFGKIIGIIIISYSLFVFGELHILPFTTISGYVVMYLFALGSGYYMWKNKSLFKLYFIKHWRSIVFYELFFFIALLFWSFVRGHQPNINGLEKFMDFGFVNSILRARYFPPRDMWLTPQYINYYYFGHLVTAVLIKLSGVPAEVGFNIMIATIFAFCLTASTSLASNIFYHVQKELHAPRNIRFWVRTFVGSSLSAFFVTFGGNLHTIYTFFKAYPNDSPVPPWQLAFQPFQFPNSYWYPNATRFIYHTIHEFPMYSFVVSDLHGHVVDIPFVLLTLALFFSIMLRKHDLEKHNNNKTASAIQYCRNIFNEDGLILIGIGFMLAIMYMTNAWDGLIYFMLAALVIMQRYLSHRFMNQITWTYTALFTLRDLVFIGISTVLFALPFSLFFKPFASGVGIICPLPFLIKLGHIGPIVFEADHCMRSPIWQLGILWGFFYFWAISLLLFLILKYKAKFHRLTTPDVYIFLLIISSTILIITPEFVYLKDIYATYFRANTMFKLVYQAFMMLGLVSGYAVIRFILLTSKKEKFILLPYIIVGSILISLVSIYPYFATRDYYDSLRTYKYLNGTTYLDAQYPGDAAAIKWINKNIKGQPVMLEAQGDSYTDYNLISANTGLPTILGWTVHEWLWRNTYDVVPPRQTDIQNIYETTDSTVAKSLLKKYTVNYVFIGEFEHKKYKVSEDKFKSIGKLIYGTNQVTIYEITPAQ